jgi:uncharacterized protein YdaU (DUF1376 family)
MGKLPYIQFYPADWLQDTMPLSLAAKGAWINILCAQWRSQSRGALTLPLTGWARQIGASVEQTKAAISELVDMHICDCPSHENVSLVTDHNEKITLVNRRMVREEKARESNACRQQRHRNKKVTQKVTFSGQASTATFGPVDAHICGFSPNENVPLVTDHNAEITFADKMTAKEKNSIESGICRHEKFGNKGITHLSNAPVTPYISEVRNQKSEKKEKDSSSPPEAVRLAKRLADKILETNPKAKIGNITAWARHVDLMLRIDGRTPEEVEAVIDWCQRDAFWCSNILSTKKLREKFDQLTAKMNPRKQAKSPGGHPPWF